MKLWQQHAQQLPVRVRPLARETLTSYISRLAAANELRRPTLLLRTLGHLHGSPTISTLLEHDIALNPLAITRLETVTGIPAARLRMALPALGRPAHQPTDIPRAEVFRIRDTGRPCDRCAARAPSGSTSRTYRPRFPTICTRHRRWLDHGALQPDHILTPNTPTRVVQTDIGAAPEILAGHRRYRRLHHDIVVDTASSRRFAQQLTTASTIVQAWAAPGRRAHHQLRQTWADRAATLWPHEPAPTPTGMLVFPETIALAEITTDPHWLHHIATARCETDLKPFFHRVAERLNQPPTFAAHTRFAGPLHHWVATTRHQHEPERRWLI